MMKRYRKMVGLIAILLPGAFYGTAQKPAGYTVFLETEMPANGTTVIFNSPVLRWPYQKGKQLQYDIELSRDSGFSSNNTMSAAALTGAFYNPHQSLQPGIWYWHYRVAGKTWSPQMNFLVTEKAFAMVSSKPTEFLAKVPQAHPRILLDDPARDIKKLSKQADALAIIEEAEKALMEKIPLEKDAQPSKEVSDGQQNKKLVSDAIVALGNQLNNMVSPLCQAFLLTHDSRYAIKAINIGMEIAGWDAQEISGSRDFTDGICMYDMALVFDTYYDQLSEEQRDILVKAISARAGGFYKSWVNNIESKVLSGHVWQLILNEFFNTCIALYRHDPQAEKWLSYAYELFLARSPVLGGLDGGWAEGAYYFHMNMETLVEIPERIKAYTGFDFINAHPWYNSQADWLIYHVPPGSSADGFGDNTEEYFEPPASYAAFAKEMAMLTQNPKYDWYAKKIQQVQKITLSKEPVLRWFRLVNGEKMKVPPGVDLLRFPMAQISKEMGIASLHTDPANPENDIMIAMRASPLGAYGHILADQNTFNILVGGKRLFYRTGYKVAMDDPHRLGWSKHTKSANGVLINGEGQPYSVEAGGYLTRFLQGNQLAYMKGDASAAYQSKETKENFGLNKFLRHIVLVKPGIIVIYDELESPSDATWSWLIHSLKNMQLDTLANTFTSTIDHAKGSGKLWSSHPISWSLSNKFDVPAVIFRNYKGMLTKKYEDTQWHVKAANQPKNRGMRFLSVIQVSKDGNVLPFKEPVKNAGMAKVVIGDWVIEASMSTDLAPQLSIESTSRKTNFAAYGNDIKFQCKNYPGTKNGSSKLVEAVNGKIKFSEVGDEPVGLSR